MAPTKKTSTIQEQQSWSWVRYRRPPAEGVYQTVIKREVLAPRLIPDTGRSIPVIHHTAGCHQECYYIAINTPDITIRNVFIEY